MILPPKSHICNIYPAFQPKMHLPVKIFAPLFPFGQECRRACLRRIVASKNAGLPALQPADPRIRPRRIAILAVPKNAGVRAVLISSNKNAGRFSAAGISFLFLLRAPEPALFDPLSLRCIAMHRIARILHQQLAGQLITFPAVRMPLCLTALRHRAFSMERVPHRLDAAPAAVRFLEFAARAVQTAP